MFKKLFLVAAIAVMFLGTISSSFATDEYRFAFSVPNIGNPYFIAVNKGFVDRCKELGVEAVTIDAQYDVAKQVSDFENLMMQGVNGILTCPIDQNALIPVVEQAKEKGIFIISEAQEVDNAHAKFTMDEYKYGSIIGGNAAKWINEKLGGKAEVIIISQDNVEPVIQRGNGIEETIKLLCPDAVIVARQAGDTPAQGMKIVENLLQSHPDVKIVTGNNDSGALGGYEAVVALKKNTPDMFVGGADATDEAIAKMKEPGSVYRATVDLFPYKTGYDAATLMYQYVTEGAPKKQEIIEMGMSPVWQEDVLSGKFPKK